MPKSRASDNLGKQLLNVCRCYQDLALRSQTHASSASCSKWYSVAQFRGWIAKHSDFCVKCIFCLAGHFCNVLGVDERKNNNSYNKNPFTGRHRVHVLLCTTVSVVAMLLEVTFLSLFAVNAV